MHAALLDRLELADVCSIRRVRALEEQVKTDGACTLPGVSIAYELFMPIMMRPSLADTYGRSMRILWPTGCASVST